MLSLASMSLPNTASNAAIKNLTLPEAARDMPSEAQKKLLQLRSELQAETKRSNIDFSSPLQEIESILLSAGELTEEKRDKLANAFNEIDRLRVNMQPQTNLSGKASVREALVSQSSQGIYLPKAAVISIPEASQVSVQYSRMPSWPEGRELPLSKTADIDKYGGNYYCDISSANGMRTYTLFFEKGCGPAEIKVEGKVIHVIDPADSRIFDPTAANAREKPQPLSITLKDMLNALQSPSRPRTQPETRTEPIREKLELHSGQLLPLVGNSLAYAKGREYLLKSGAKLQVVGDNEGADLCYLIARESNGKTSYNLYRFEASTKKWQTLGKDESYDGKSLKQRIKNWVDVGQAEGEFTIDTPRHHAINEVTHVLKTAHDLKGTRSDASLSITQALKDTEGRRLETLRAEISSTMPNFSQEEVNSALNVHQILKAAGFNIAADGKKYVLNLPNGRSWSLQPARKEGKVVWESCSGSEAVADLLKAGIPAQSEDSIGFLHAANVWAAISTQQGENSAEAKREDAAKWVSRFTARSEGYALAKQLQDIDTEIQLGGTDDLFGPDKDFLIEFGQGSRGGRFWYNSAEGQWKSEPTVEGEAETNPFKVFVRKNTPFLDPTHRDHRGLHIREAFRRVLSVLDGQSDEP